MLRNQKVEKFIQNLMVAFISQGFSLISSVVISFFVPKILGVAQFGYWQLFLLYSSFSGLFIFGVREGLYLNCGGAKYQQLDFKKICSQFWLITVLQFLAATFILLIAAAFVSDYNRFYIIISVLISVIISNIYLFIGYIFQATNETQLYSNSLILNKIVLLVLVTFLVVGNVKSYEAYILAFLISLIFSMVYCCIKGKEVILSPFLNLRETFICMFQNISIGFSLLVSNFTGMLIIGIGRFIIDNLWGIETFGKISFAVSLANFFLLFISQISMVLFPALKQTNQDNQRKVYNFGNDTLSIILTGIFFIYLPVKYLLGLWLPQYRESLEYLAILLPICAFDGKMQMLCSTYMKVLRKERILLLFNVVSLVICTCLCLVSGYILHSVQAILISMVAAITIRSILSDLYVSRIIGVTVVKNIIGEVALAVWFIFCTYSFTPLVAFTLFLIFYLFFLYQNRNRIQSLKVTAYALLKTSKI